MNKKVLLSIGAIVLVCTLIFIVAVSKPEKVKETPSEIFTEALTDTTRERFTVTVNGDVISPEEIEYFTKRNREKVMNDYASRYDISGIENFWYSRFDGVIPEDTLYDICLENAVQYKVAFQLMKENGIYDTTSYADFYKMAQEYNKNNEGQNATSGLSRIDLDNFYTYYFSSGKAKLERIIGTLDIDSYINDKINEAEIINR